MATVTFDQAIRVCYEVLVPRPEAAHLFDTATGPRLPDA